MSQAVIEKRLMAILQDMIEDWELELPHPIGLHTRLVEDLGFTSVDLMQLAAAIEQAFAVRGLPFEEVLMEEGRYVEDLDVSTLVGFLTRHVGLS